MCKQKGVVKKVHNLSLDSAENDSDSEMFYVDTVSEGKKCGKSTKEWFESVKCNNKELLVKIDTGSMMNVISKSEYLRIGLSIKQLRPFSKRVYSFTGNRLPVLGVVKLNVVYNNKQFVLPFIVTDSCCQNLLGLESCITMGVINCINAINIENYSSLFKGLGMLPGKYSIVVDKSVPPVISPTRKIPLGMKDKLLVELKRMEGLGVVRKVTHPTEWVNAIVLVAKKDGSIRVCLDPRPLNRAVRRAQYSLPTVTELAVKLHGARVFSVLDARCGFWMVQIDDASADLCTFSTPFGRYQFLRLPYGISCAPEVFHAKLRQHLEDLEGVESFIDDVIVYGSTQHEHDQRLEALLKRAQDVGIKFNRDKCKFSVPEITYLGHKFDANGMKADDSKVKAILDMPYPTDKKSLERFLGMVNYLSKFIQSYSEYVNVLRSLLKKDAEWVWEAYHSEAVDKLKEKIASSPVLAIYSTEAPVVLSVDASSVAIGAVLLQNERPVEFASLTLTDTQTRYAQIEKEMLAIVFAVERFRQYIYGRSDITVHTDHKPLEALFKKPLTSVPIRLQRMMLRVQGFDIKVIYTPGKYMYIADTLSRAPLGELMQNYVSDEVNVQTCFMLKNIPFSLSKIESIIKDTETDSDCKLLITYIKNGWPKHRRDVSDNVSVFWPYREQLSYVDGLIFKGDRVFIPLRLREKMLERVHEGHLGIDRCKRRAREVMFWPGMSAEVERVARCCKACALHAPRPRRQPLLQHHVPDLPWQKLASDIFEYKRKKYILLVDYFSNYVEVEELPGISSKHVINFMKTQFARHGIPAEIVTDNGPAYRSKEFQNFLNEWEIDHVTSSPHYSQSNGKSERTVQTIKSLLKKCVDSGQDFYLSLLNFRSTPRNGLDSPAQMLMGRRIKTKLPISEKLLRAPVDNDRNYQSLMAHREKIKKQYDKSTKSLERLSVGDKATLLCNAGRKPVSVVARAEEPRSFIVEDEQGKRFRRTRSHLILRSKDYGKPRLSRTSSSTAEFQSSILDKSTIASWGVRRRRKVGSETQADSQVCPQTDRAPSSQPSTPTTPGTDRAFTECVSSPPSPIVNINRSKERTARMLAEKKNEK